MMATGEICMCPTMSASCAGNCEMARAALIMSAPRKIKKIMPLVCAVVRMLASRRSRFISPRTRVMANVSTLPMAAPSVAVNRPP